MRISEVNGFLGRNHFVFLGICAVYIITAILLLKKFRVPFKSVLNIMIVIAVASELIKINEYLVPYGVVDGVAEGFYFKKTGLPFHLCSIQLLLLLLTKICKEGSFRDKLLAFVYPTAFLGALMALIMVTVDVEFNNPLTWQFFMFHASLLVYGIYIPMSKEVKIDTKMFINTCICLIGLFFVSVYINGLVSVPELDVLDKDGQIIGITEGIYVYFFYSTEPPIQNLPILNMANGWWAYIVSIMLIGLIAVSIVHIPFFIKDYKEHKFNKKQIEN